MLILSSALKVINKPNFIIICINNILHRKSLQQNGGTLKKCKTTLCALIKCNLIVRFYFLFVNELNKIHRLLFVINYLVYILYFSYIFFKYSYY